MDSTDAVCVREVSKETIAQTNKAIRELDFKHLPGIERNLDFSEKVSLTFLLYAADPCQFKVILDRLIVLSHDPYTETDYLETWAPKAGKNWKNILLEALCLIQAKSILFMLGIDYDDLEQRYALSSFGRYDSLNIPCIAKLLYYVCEEMTVKQSRALIDYVMANHPKVRDFNYSDNGEHLELYLLYWQWQGVIQIDQSKACDLGVIIQYLKQAEMESLKDIIIDVTKTFNKKFDVKVEPTKIEKKRNQNQTDFNHATSLEGASGSFESMRLTTADMEFSYKIRKESAGYILIINQKKFHREKDENLKKFLPEEDLSERFGTERDEDILVRVFSAFGYQKRIKDNLKHCEILDAIREVVNESGKFDSLIVCILSHGHKGCVYGANSIPVDIEMIENIMISDRMIGKPKVLIIQACQGAATLKAKPINRLATDAPLRKTQAAYTDLLTCISAVPGFTSFRHEEKGSWFIQILCRKLEELAHRAHFADILTIVCREVSDKRGWWNECMVSIHRSTLRSFLYLPTGSSGQIASIPEKA